MRSALLFPLLLCLLLVACDLHDGDENAFLFKIGDSGVSVAEFKQALEMEQPSALTRQGDGDLEAVLTFLNQMIEERLLLARAKELDIVIDEALLEAAITKVRADYPDDTFEETLLESAVSFNQWREQFRRRLLLERVVTHELEERVEIAPEDVAAYYAEHYADRQSAEAQAPMTAESINAAIVKHLRRTKAQEQYPLWIQGLQERYGLVVDWQRWHQLTEKLHPAATTGDKTEMRLVSPPSVSSEKP